MQVVSMFAIGGCWRRADPDENSNEELRRDAESGASRASGRRPRSVVRTSNVLIARIFCDGSVRSETCEARSFRHGIFIHFSPAALLPLPLAVKVEAEHPRVGRFLRVQWRNRVRQPKQYQCVAAQRWQRFASDGYVQWFASMADLSPDSALARRRGHRGNSTLGTEEVRLEPNWLPFLLCLCER